MKSIELDQWCGAIMHPLGSVDERVAETVTLEGWVELCVGDSVKCFFEVLTARLGAPSCFLHKRWLLTQLPLHPGLFSQVPCKTELTGGVLPPLVLSGVPLCGPESYSPYLVAWWASNHPEFAFLVVLADVLSFHVFACVWCYSSVHLIEDITKVFSCYGPVSCVEFKPQSIASWSYVAPSRS